MIEAFGVLDDSERQPDADRLRPRISRPSTCPLVYPVETPGPAATSREEGQGPGAERRRSQSSRRSKTGSMPSRATTLEGTYRPRRGGLTPVPYPPRKARKTFDQVLKSHYRTDEQIGRAQAALQQADRQWRAARDAAVGRTTADLLSRFNSGGTDASYRRGAAAKKPRHLNTTATAAFWQDIFTSRTEAVRERASYSDEAVIITTGQVSAAIKKMKRKSLAPDGTDFRFFRAFRDEVIRGADTQLPLSHEGTARRTTWRTHSP
jgi:hypothetical protein